MNEDGSMAKGQDLFNFAKKHNLKIGKIEDLIAYRLKKEKLIRLKKKSDIKVKNQKYKIRIYENLLDGSEHFALIKGNIKKKYNTQSSSDLFKCSAKLFNEPTITKLIQ